MNLSGKMVFTIFEQVQVNPQTNNQFCDTLNFACII